MNGLMSGKRGLIMGLANDRSLAWGVAKRLASRAAELAFSLSGASAGKRGGPTPASRPPNLRCDVSDWTRSTRLRQNLNERWETIISAPRHLLLRQTSVLQYVDTLREFRDDGFSLATLTAVAKRDRR